MGRTPALIVLLSAVALHVQLPFVDQQALTQTGSGMIRGRIVAADGGGVLRNAQVTISGPTTPPRVFTDSDGRFVFSNLAFGRYALVVRKAGYAQTRFGSRHAADPPMWIELTAASPAFNADVRVPRSGAISGRILDDRNDPIELAQVAAERIIRTDGRVTAVTVASTTTDDLGEYRLGGLPEGRYIVWARRSSSDTVRFMVNGVSGELARPDGAAVHAYYPGTTTLSEAHAVEVHAGEDHSSIDFPLAQHTQAPAMVRLSFIDGDGKPILATSMIVRLDDAIAGTAINASGIGATVAHGVDPGAWLIVARAVYAPGVAAVPIVVGSSDLSIPVLLRSGGRISGRVVVDGGLPATSPLEIDIEARPVEAALARMPGAPAMTRARAGETFTLTDLIGTRELRIGSTPHGWAVKAIRAGGRNLLDVPLPFNGDEQVANVEIVLTHEVAELNGTVDRSSVLVFPDRLARYRDLRRVARWVRPDQNGRFVVDDLLPGTYSVVATDDVDDAQWANADYLEQFRARATRVTLKAGDRRSIAMRADATP
jgi:carboxypeptidase family protein